jgi:hypothetical protein
MRNLILIWLAAATVAAFGQDTFLTPSIDSPTAFAVITDDATYARCDAAIGDYAASIQETGLGVYIVAENWEQPRDVRATISTLLKSDPPIEGFVLVGDVPIAMIRDGQHLTSAFKMDQVRYPIFRSSVPSDRYYDDLDLVFEYLGPDTSRPLVHYFSLAAASPQTIERELYSGRIRPPTHGDDKYDEISSFLHKAAAAKRAPDKLDDMLVFTGHGYYSEALTAWADEQIALREQFPRLFVPGGTLTYLRFDMSREMKEIVMLELVRESLDFALFHAHGSVDMQYLIGYPVPRNAGENVESIRMFLRSKLRTFKRWGRDIDEAKQYYIDQYGVTEEWFEGAFEDSSIAADSIVEYKLDLYARDVDAIEPGAEFVIFDECFNGSFHREGYIAGSYLFGDGATVAAYANSVNCLQDKWADKDLGLLARGVSVGEAHKSWNYLENHVLGDPTFFFAPSAGERLSLPDEEEVVLRLGADDPNLRAHAVSTLSRGAGGFSDEALRRFETEESFVVRLALLDALAYARDVNLERVLPIAARDPYEFIRRKAVELMGQIGDPKFVPVLIDAVMNDPSKRVSFNGRNALSVMPFDSVIGAMKRYIDSAPEFLDKAALHETMDAKFERDRAWLWEELLPEINDDTLALKKRIGAVRTLRNYRFVEGIDEIIKVALDSEQPDELRVAILEALGWYVYSFKRENIVNACDQIIARADAPESVRNEAIKTKARIVEGPNVPLTP